MKTPTRYILLSIICSLAYTVASPTIIMVVIKDNEAWIVADGLRSGGGTYETVQKIHKAFGGLLLKHGNNGGVDGLLSSDAEVHDLVQSSRSFDDFKISVSEVLTVHARRNLRSFIKDNDLDDFRYYADSTTAKRPDIKDIMPGRTGLAFINYRAGILYIQDWQPRYIEEVVHQKNVSDRYRIKIVNDAWIVRSGEQFLLYPTESGFYNDPTKVLLAHPEKLESLLEDMESQSPCMTAEPNLVLHLKAPSSIPPPYDIKVEVLKGVLRDDWKTTPIDRPTACSITEEYREKHHLN